MGRRCDREGTEKSSHPRQRFRGRHLWKSRGRGIDRVQFNEFCPISWPKSEPHGKPRVQRPKPQAPVTLLFRIALVLGKRRRSHATDGTCLSIGLGGNLGSGKQWMSWIHVTDVTGSFFMPLRTSSVRGPLNGASPDPVRNEEFTRIMGEILKRPAFLAAPEFALRLPPCAMKLAAPRQPTHHPGKSPPIRFPIPFPRLAKRADRHLGVAIPEGSCRALENIRDLPHPW